MRHWSFFFFFHLFQSHTVRSYFTSESGIYCVYLVHASCFSTQYMCIKAGFALKPPQTFSKPQRRSEWWATMTPFLRHVFSDGVESECVRSGCWRVIYYTHRRGYKQHYIEALILLSPLSIYVFTINSYNMDYWIGFLKFGYHLFCCLQQAGN